MTMLAEMFPWIGTGFEVLLYGIAGGVALTALYFLGRLIRFWRTAR